MWVRIVSFMPDWLSLIQLRSTIIFRSSLCYEMELHKELLAHSNMKTILSGKMIPTIKRCSHDCLILIMGIPVLTTVVGWLFYIEMAPWGAPYSSNSSNLTVLPSDCLQDHRDQTGLHVWVNLAVTVIYPLRLYYLCIIRKCIVTNCVVLLFIHISHIFRFSLSMYGSITDVTVLLWQAICIWVHTSVALCLFYVITMVAIPEGLAS